MNRIKATGLLLLFLLPGIPRQAAAQVDDYMQSIRDWQQKRLASLTRPNGWLSLAGLYWLEEGENRFGTAADNPLRFPEGKAPGHIGSIFVQGHSLWVAIKPGVEVLCDSVPVNSISLRSDADGRPTILTLGTLSWYIIRRGDRYLVRLKDTENPALKNFTGIDTYPIDISWRIPARLETYDPPKQVPIPNILGQVSEENSPGALVFEIGGREYRLDPLGEPGDKHFFLIFADETNGVETYGAGRFLSVDAPGPDGRTFIDFNKAYNPPCAFTDYATCPLPPKQNRLPLRVTAGEKNYGHHHH